LTTNRSTSLPGLILLGLAVALLLAWRIIVTNMAEWHLQEDGQKSAAHALRWDNTNAQALHQEGLRIVKSSPTQAMAYLKAAVRDDPTDGPTYAVTAQLTE